MKMFRQLTSFVSLSLLCVITTAASAQAANRDEVIFFFNDHLGSAVAAVNEAGELCWSEEYTAYGDKGINDDVFNTTGCGIVGEERGFTGHTEDMNSDLVYMQQRYYDPSIGRFLSIDPVDSNPNSPVTFNRYAYGNNNPYKYTDPDGEFAFLIPVAVFIAKEIVAEVASDATGGASDFLSVRRTGTRLAKSVADQLGKHLKSNPSGVTDKVDLNLSYKDGWTEAQKKAADQKCQALCDADTVVTEAQRSGTSASTRYKRAGNTVSNGDDVDHVIDLQLGGADNVTNMLPLNSSVNRSLGAQIHHQIKNLPVGTVVDKITIQ